MAAPGSETRTSEDGSARRRSAGITATSITCALALVCAFALVADAEQPDATIRIEQYQVAFIGSGNLGGGVLNYKGRKYEFTVGGLGIGGIGVSKVTATGEVYGLKDISQFQGAYFQGRTGFAAADKGSGNFWVENTNGVYIKLKSENQGLALALGGDAIYIQVK